MSKREFLNGLEEALQGEVKRSVILDNIAYYETYIDQQISKGYTEEAVMETLGSPNLIAKTIIETGGGTGSYDAGDPEEFTDAYNRELRKAYFRENAEAAGMDYDNTGSSGVFIINGRRYDTGKWYVKALIAAVVILIVLVIAFLLIIILKGIYLAVKWLALPVLVVCLISYILKRLL